MTNTMNPEKLQYELEELIDKVDLLHVLAAISDICQVKAEHLQSNWQDEYASKLWAKSSKLIDAAISKLPVYPGINQ